MSLIFDGTTIFMTRKKQLKESNTKYKQSNKKIAKMKIYLIKQRSVNIGGWVQIETNICNFVFWNSVNDVRNNRLLIQVD